MRLGTYWEILWSSGWVLCFTAGVEASDLVCSPLLYLHQAWLCWPSAALGSGTGKRNIDGHVSLGFCILRKGLQRHKGKLKALSLPTGGLGGAVLRQAGLWTALLLYLGFPELLCLCVFLTCSLVGFSILLTVLLEHDWEVKATWVCPPGAPGQFCHAKAAAQAFFGGTS